MLKAQKLKHGAEFIDTSTPQVRKMSVAKKPQKEIPRAIENQEPPAPIPDQYNNQYEKFYSTKYSGASYLVLLLFKEPV